jgi:acetyl esterase/lipase
MDEPHPSDLAALRGIMSLVTGHSENPPQTIPEGRARNDLHGLSVPIATGCTKASVSAHGIDCERLTPREAEPGRILLCLHGGGFTQGSAVSHRHYASRLARAARAEALVPNYRLAPEHPFPAAVEDALACYRWLLEQGFAPERIAIMGDSAGGGLAVAAALAIRDEGLPAPAAVYAISPWVDLTEVPPSYAERAALDPVVTLESLHRMSALYAGETDRRHPLLSPLHADLSGLPPLFIHVATDEILYEDGLRLAEAARAAGVDVTLRVGERMIHVWPLFHEILRAGRAAIGEAGDWLFERMSEPLSSGAEDTPHHRAHVQGP